MYIPPGYIARRNVHSSVFEFSVRWWGIILRICWKPISVSNPNWTLIWHLRKVPWALRKVWQPGGKSADSDFPRVWKTFPQADRLSTRAHVRVPFGRFYKCQHSQFTYSLLIKRNLTIFERVSLPQPGFEPGTVHTEGECLTTWSTKLP